MAAQNQNEKKTTSSEEVVSPISPSVMRTSSINLGHIEVLQILNEHGEVDRGLEPKLSDEKLFGNLVPKTNHHATGTIYVLLF